MSTKTEEKPAEKPSISDKQANREKIRITMLQATNREKALALAVKLTEEMPDMDYEITSELQFCLKIRSQHVSLFAQICRIC